MDTSCIDNFDINKLSPSRDDNFGKIPINDVSYSTGGVQPCLPQSDMEINSASTVLETIMADGAVTKNPTSPDILQNAIQDLNLTSLDMIPLQSQVNVELGTSSTVSDKIDIVVTEQNTDNPKVDIYYCQTSAPTSPSKNTHQVDDSEKGDSGNEKSDSFDDSVIDPTPIKKIQRRRRVKKIAVNTVANDITKKLNDDTDDEEPPASPKKTKKMILKKKNEPPAQVAEKSDSGSDSDSNNSNTSSSSDSSDSDIEQSSDDYSMSEFETEGSDSEDIEITDNYVLKQQRKHLREIDDDEFNKYNFRERKTEFINSAVRLHLHAELDTKPFTFPKVKKIPKYRDVKFNLSFVSSKKELKNLPKVTISDNFMQPTDHEIVYKSWYNLLPLTQFFKEEFSTISDPVQLAEMDIGKYLHLISTYSEKVFVDKPTLVNNANYCQTEYPLVYGAIPKFMKYPAIWYVRTKIKEFKKLLEEKKKPKLKINTTPDGEIESKNILKEEKKKPKSKNYTTPFSDGEIESFCYLYWITYHTDLLNWDDSENNTSLKSHLYLALKYTTEYKDYEYLATYAKLHQKSLVTAECLIYIKQKYSSIIQHVHNAYSEDPKTRSLAKQAWDHFMLKANVHHYSCVHTINDVVKKMKNFGKFLQFKYEDLKLSDCHIDTTYTLSKTDVLKILNFWPNVKKDVKFTDKTYQVFTDMFGLFNGVFAQHLITMGLLKTSSHVVIDHVYGFASLRQYQTDFDVVHTQFEPLPLAKNTVAAFKKRLRENLYSMIVGDKAITIDDNAVLYLIKIISLIIVRQVSILQMLVTEDKNETPEKLNKRMIKILKDYMESDRFLSMRNISLFSWGATQDSAYVEEKIDAGEEGIDGEEKVVLEEYSDDDIADECDDECKEAIDDPDHKCRRVIIKNSEANDLYNSLDLVFRKEPEKYEFIVVDEPKPKSVKKTKNYPVYIKGRCAVEINDKRDDNLVFDKKNKPKLSSSKSDIPLLNEQDSKSAILKVTENTIVITDDEMVSTKSSSETINRNGIISNDNNIETEQVTRKRGRSQKKGVDTIKEEPKIKKAKTINTLECDDYMMGGQIKRVHCAMCNSSMTQNTIIFRKTGKTKIQVPCCAQCYRRLVDDCLSDKMKFDHNSIKERILSNYAKPVAFRQITREYIPDEDFDKSQTRCIYNILDPGFKKRKYTVSRK